MHDRMRKEQNKPDDVLRRNVRHKVPPRDGKPRAAILTCRQDIGLRAQLHDFRTDDTRQTRPMRDDDADGYAEDSAAHHHRNHEDEEDVRNSHAEIDEPKNEAIHLAAECRRQRSEDERDAGAEKRGGKTDLQTDRHALDGAQKHVAPHVVRTEWMQDGRRKIFLSEVDRIGTLIHRRTPEEHSQNEQGRKHGKDEPALTDTQTALREGKRLVHDIPLPSRSCGSTIPYRMLAMRLPTKIKIALKTAMPSSSARSPRSPASVTVLPSPG